MNRAPAVAYARDGATSIYEGLTPATAHSRLSIGEPVMGGVWEGEAQPCAWPHTTKSGNMCQAHPIEGDPDGYCIGHGRARDAKARRRAQETE